jgi:hypothetical protein
VRTVDVEIIYRSAAAVDNVWVKLPRQPVCC